MSEKICLFAGTTEGRRMADIIRNAADLTVCVATEYGEIMLDGIDGIDVRVGRMDESEMENFFAENHFSLIIDATHPYAELVTENIQAAAAKAGIRVMRILRETERDIAGAVYVPSVEAARDYLAGREGNIFLTTGSKELSLYAGLDMQRVWARVLPTAASLESCQAAGIPQAHIIAAQGPFSEEINIAQMKMIGAKYMVTKASGKNGGFDEKINAAKKAGVSPVVIGQPKQIEGFLLGEALIELQKTLPISKRRIDIIGVGPGAEGFLTVSAREALHLCDAVIGAKSVVETLNINKPAVYEFTAQKILAALEADKSIRHAAVVMRGDTGFFSGAKNLSGAFEGYEVSVIPGISSVSLLAARLNVSWDGAALISLHGRNGSLIRTVRSRRASFVLTGGDNTVAAVCGRLTDYSLGSVKVYVGERLSYPDERITSGTAEELKDMEFDPLSVLYIENDGAKDDFRVGIPDDEFIRGDVPMTKQEVRALSMSKLAPDSDSVIWDIGAGTGSVSVECALAAYDGTVCAIEKEHDAVELIKSNKLKFGAEHIEIIEGKAPEALDGLPCPTHAFIGGSSGELKEIIGLLIERNPDVRIVINAITVETKTEADICAREFGFRLYETVDIFAARSRKLGRYHMMTAQNPVSVITLQGAEKNA